ncbi:hypothetical protein HZC20_03240 [Candidatus Peregrinibacteria bacterium]|nr:hypothetical protein [Candidatus Peregrinibacteria bacterium]
MKFQSRKVLGISLLVITSLGIFSACSFFNKDDPGKNSAQIIQDGLKNLYATTSSNFKIHVKGDTSSQANKSSFDVNFGGSADSKDSKNPIGNFKLDVNGVMPATGSTKSQSLSAELRLDKNFVYAIVSKADVEPKDMFNGIVGQWWKMKLPADTFGNQVSVFGAKEKLSEKDKKIRDLLEKTVFFKDIKYTGDEGGSYQFEATFDKVAVRDFTIALGQINGTYGQTVTDDVKKQIDKNFDPFTINPIKIGVQKSGKILDKFNVSLIYTKPDSGTAPSPEDVDKTNLSFELSLSDFNKAVTVEAPKDAKEFDPASVFGGPVSPVAPATPVAPSAPKIK